MAGHPATRHRELKLKLAMLEKQYDDLHSALFEAAEVHRRLCAPRLVRYGDFEIASEIFAVRYLPGDFFTIEETRGGLILALGDVCRKGLAAGMWTPCLVGLVRAHAAASSEPHAIMAGVNREFCRMHAPLTSLFMARLDRASDTVEYCSAGHPPALLLRAKRAARVALRGWHAARDGWRRLVQHGTRGTQRRRRAAGYSDGVIESRDGSDEEFGCERLEAHLRRAGTGSSTPRYFSILAGSGFRCSQRADRRHITHRGSSLSW